MSGTEQPLSAVSFWANVCKTVRPMLSDRCLFVLSVCNVGVLRPNGWIDQDATWYGGRPQPKLHCVRQGPSSPPPEGAQQPAILAHVYCGQTAGWIKMPLGTEVSLGPGDIVLDGSQFPPPKRGTAAPSPLFGPYLLWPNGRPSPLLLSSC